MNGSARGSWDDTGTSTSCAQAHSEIVASTVNNIFFILFLAKDEQTQYAGLAEESDQVVTDEQFG